VLQVVTLQQVAISITGDVLRAHPHPGVSLPTKPHPRAGGARILKSPKIEANLNVRLMDA
jgi:hypothetical protein